MCFLLYKPADATIKPEWIDNAYESNKDGFGISYKLDGKLFIQKGLYTLEQCHEACKAIPANASALVHFRWATHGSVCEANCHPFVIGQATCAHNGVIMGYGNGDMTDSEHFMRIHKIDTITNDDIAKIELSLGTNKMVLLRPDDAEDIILNEKHGFWLDGCWHSNYGALTHIPKFEPIVDDNDEYHLPEVDPFDTEDDTCEGKVFALINAIEDALPYLTKETKQAERLLEMLYVR